jgi:hypothetical protein
MRYPRAMADRVAPRAVRTRILRDFGAWSGIGYLLYVPYIGWRRVGSGSTLDGCTKRPAKVEG